MSGIPPEGVVAAVLEAWAESGRINRVRVEGESMQPLLSPGDCVLVAHRRPRLRRGQVLACLVSDRLLVHRLVRLEGSQLFLAGDNRPGPDASISIREVLGQVVAVENGATRVPLDTAVARALGLAIALSEPLRRRRGWRRLAHWLVALNARLLRR